MHELWSKISEIHHFISFAFHIFYPTWVFLALKYQQTFVLRAFASDLTDKWLHNSVECMWFKSHWYGAISTSVTASHMYRLHPAVQTARLAQSLCLPPHSLTFLLLNGEIRLLCNSYISLQLNSVFMFVMLTVLQQTAQLITFHRWVHAVTAAAVCSWAERFQHILGCQQTLASCGHGIPGMSLNFQNKVRTVVNSQDNSVNINEKKMISHPWMNAPQILIFPPLFLHLSRSDNITDRSGPVRLACLYQPPGAEDLSVQPASCALRLPNPHPGWLGDPQRSEWQALLLQPGHWGADLEATTHQGY